MSDIVHDVRVYVCVSECDSEDIAKSQAWRVPRVKSREKFGAENHGGIHWAMTSPFDLRNSPIPIALLSYPLTIHHAGMFEQLVLINLLGSMIY